MSNEANFTSAELRELGLSTYAELTAESVRLKQKIEGALTYLGDGTSAEAHELRAILEGTPE